MVSCDMVYEAFRRFLVKQLRIYDENTVHVGECTNCLRKAYYNRKNGSMDLSHLAPSKRVILGLGLSTHLVFEEILKEMGYRTEQQIIKDFNGFKLAGTPDAINEDHVIEIKTCNRLPDKALPHHVMQLNAYLALTGRKLGFIIYICKRDGNVRIFSIEFDEKMFQDLLSRAAKLHKCLKENKPPEPEPSYLCNYCEWKWECLKVAK